VIVGDLVARLRPSAPGTTLTRTEIEALFGCRLPADYLDFVAAFPPGEFGNEVRVLHPDLYESETRTLHDIAEFFGRTEADFPFTFGTGDGELLIWGSLNIVVLLAWRVSDAEPDRWPVVVVNDDLEWREFPYGMAEFLATVVGAAEPVVLGYVPLTDDSFTYARFVALSATDLVTPKAGHGRADRRLGRDRCHADGSHRADHRSVGRRRRIRGRRLLRRVAPLRLREPDA
jgi:hypothetical protein